MTMYLQVLCFVCDALAFTCQNCIQMLSHRIAAAAAKDTLDELWNKYFHLITFSSRIALNEAYNGRDVCHDISHARPTCITDRMWRKRRWKWISILFSIVVSYFSLFQCSKWNGNRCWTTLYIAAGKWHLNADRNELIHSMTLDEVVWRTRNVLAFRFHVNWMLRCTFRQNARSVYEQFVPQVSFYRRWSISPVIAFLWCDRVLAQNLHSSMHFTFPKLRVLCKWICEAIHRSSLQFGDGIDAIVIMIWIVSNVKFVLSKSMASTTSENTENSPPSSTQSLYAHSKKK